MKPLDIAYLSKDLLSRGPYFEGVGSEQGFMRFNFVVIE